MNTFENILADQSLNKLIHHKGINILIKSIVVFLLAMIIYQQVVAKDNIHDLWNAFYEQLAWQNIHWVVFALFLMPINWAFETMKWQQLIKNFETISFGKAYQAIFSGITFSIFTPNRVGEYGGRILMVKPENNWKAVIATLVGSFSQLLVLLTMGWLGLIYFIQHYVEMENLLLLGISCIGVALLLLMIFVFYNVDMMIPIAKKIPYIHKFKHFIKHVRVLKNYTSRELTMTLGYSLARYLVYMIQYYLFLQFFGIEITLVAALASIATIFLLQTSIPLPPLAGLFVRGEVALFVWSHFSTNELSILAATFSLWILNLIIPSLIGAVFIINTNVLKSLGYEKNNA